MTTLTLRPYQGRVLDDLWAWFARHPNGSPIVDASVGCHAAGQSILMADGSVKPVEDVVVGDSLMGGDGTPREVLRLCRGVGRMFRVAPTKGDAFIVNEDHVLSLRRTPCKTGEAPVVVNLTVREFLRLPPSARANMKLYRGDGCDFIRPVGRSALSPYFVGLFLGGGSCTNPPSRRGGFSTPAVTTIDEEIRQAVIRQADSLGLRVTERKKIGTDALHLAIRGERRGVGVTDPLTQELRRLGIAGHTSAEKFIPDEFKCAPRAERLELLAGLIDTDGARHRTGFDFVSQSHRLAEDVAFVARSLGLAAYIARAPKTCQTGAVGEYWRVGISGDCSVVPVRIERKRPPARTQKKSVLVTGFDICPVGEGAFFGFTLSGDHLYMMGDFTVTHNSGKSLMIAAVAERMDREAPGTRSLVIVHQKELLIQNHDKLRALAPHITAGIYSAAVGRKELGRQVTFATIGSIYRIAHRIGNIGIVHCDEAHLVNPRETGMWRSFMKDMARYCPGARVVGWTGTPFRGNGVYLTAGEETLFTGVAARVTMAELLQQGFLAPLVPVATQTQINTDDVALSGGDYVVSQLEKASDKDELVQAAADEACRLAADRKRWLVFCVTVEHAEHVAQALRERGVAAMMVCGETPKEERDRLIDDFRAGRLRCLVNVAMLTTGFDAPEVDCIINLRSTRSPVLYVQVSGRGMRTAPGKTDCAWLDFTDTTARLGPVDLIKGRGPAPKKGAAEAPFRLCPECGSRCHAAATECIDCGFKFPEPETIKHGAVASAAEVLATVAKNAIRDVAIGKVTYARHVKDGKPDSLRVEYWAGLSVVAKEWVLLDHPGYPRLKAEKWWRDRAPYGTSLPANVADALVVADRMLRKPAGITIDTRKRYPEVLAYRWGDEEAAKEAA